MANIYINTTPILKASLGNTGVLGIYIGNKKVWPTTSLLLADSNGYDELRINADIPNSDDNIHIALDS